MSRIDIVRLRKNSGISQRQLADMLDIRPSFLSAIENGRSRLPDDKQDKLKLLFPDLKIDDYLIDENKEKTVPPHSHIHDQGDSLTQLLNHFHDLAHQKYDDQSEKEGELNQRIQNLSKRNDRLSDRLDDLRDEVDRLREENLRLKELLVRHGISYSDCIG